MTIDNLRNAFNNILYAYIFIAYFLMFAILIENRNHTNICSRNTLELMTAAAPITLMYLVVKNLSSAKSCKENNTFKGDIR